MSNFKSLFPPLSELPPYRNNNGAWNNMLQKYFKEYTLRVF